MEAISEKGQFRVQVDGRTVLSRRGGLFALLTRKPWPSEEEVLTAVRSALPPAR